MSSTALHDRLRDTTTVPLSRFRRHYAMPANWLDGFYVGPGVDIPPRREDCRCACSAKVRRTGQFVHVGLCPPDVDCDRRPR